MLDAGHLEHPADGVEHRVRNDHGHIAFVELGVELLGRRHNSIEQLTGGHVQELGVFVSCTHARGRSERRGGGHHHPVGQLHDPGGNSIADAEPDHPRRLDVGKMPEHIGPVVGCQRAGGLSDVADHGEAAVEGTARDHAELHRSEVLNLVDHDVTISADLVGLVDLASPTRSRAEVAARLVEQGDVVLGPAHFGDVIRARAVQGQILGLAEVA